MIRAIRKVIVVCMLGCLSSVLPCQGQEHRTVDPRSYVLDKLGVHDVVFMGTTHKQPPILDLLAELVPDLRGTGVTHLALEISRDQQENIDRFLAYGTGLEDIALHGAIDCPAYRRLLSVLQLLGPGQRPQVVAIDMPERGYSGAVSRNAYMAMTLSETLQSNPQTKILVILGSLHVLRNLQWQSRVGDGNEAIRTRLARWRPDLRLFSMVHVIAGAGVCDFSRRLGPLPGMVALDVDAGFKGWRLGVTACLALHPSQPHELVDGVIVH